MAGAAWAAQRSVQSSELPAAVGRVAGLGLCLWPAALIRAVSHAFLQMVDSADSWKAGLRLWLPLSRGTVMATCRALFVP